MTIPLRHGVFVVPFHVMNENPTQCLHRALRLCELLDDLGFNEAWVGEHHSAGMEIIASPELFIAAAAERTKHIRFGTGVISLPYHNPLMAANRIIQLDHQTMGRCSFGFGMVLLLAKNCADWEATKHSYELYARYVMPHYAKASASRLASYKWVTDNQPDFSNRRQHAQDSMIARHMADEEQKAKLKKPQ